MQDEIPVVVVSTPVELPHYFEQIVSYLMSNFPDIFHSTATTIGIIMGFSIPLCLLFIIGIMLSLHGIHTVRRREHEIYNKRIETAYDEVTEADPETVNKWQKIVALVESDNESDWRQSIIEADIILGILLTKMGYRGETIGEQMSRVEPGDFKTLAKASEAHHVRNRIAHDGTDYPLNQTEARHVISLFKDVFQEFNYI